MNDRPGFEVGTGAACEQGGPVQPKLSPDRRLNELLGDLPPPHPGEIDAEDLALDALITRILES